MKARVLDGCVDPAGRKRGGSELQEQDILEFLAEGATNRQIDERLYLAEKTVRNHVSGLLSKLGVQRASEAAAYAARRFPQTPHVE